MTSNVHNRLKFGKMSKKVLLYTKMYKNENRQFDRRGTLTATAYQLVFTTSLKSLTATYCTHLLTHHMLRSPSLILNFLDYDVSVETTLTSPVSQMKCANFSKTDSVVVRGRDRVQEIDHDQRTALQTSQRSYHPQNQTVKKHNFK